MAGADLFFAILLEPLLNLDQVPAEARLHRFGHLARLQRESRIGKGRDHPLAAEGPQVAAVDRRALVVGDHLGQFGEVGTSQDLLAQAAYFLGNFERIPSAGGLGKEHVLEANLGGMLVLGEVLLVVGGHVGVGDLDRVVGRSATRSKHVFDRHLLVGLVEVLPRLARAHLYHTGQDPLQLVAEQLLSEDALDLQDKGLVVGILEIVQIADKRAVLGHVELALGLEGFDLLHRWRRTGPRIVRQFLIGNLNTQPLDLLHQQDVADIAVPYLAHQLALVGALLLWHLARHVAQRTLEFSESDPLAVDHADVVADIDLTSARIVGAPLDHDQADEGKNHHPQHQPRLFAQNRHHKLYISCYLIAAICRVGRQLVPHFGGIAQQAGRAVAAAQIDQARHHAGA